MRCLDRLKPRPLSISTAFSQRFVNLPVDDRETRLKEGDLSQFADAFLVHRPRLWQIVHFRLNDRIRGRVDPDDVVQDIYLAAEKRLRHFIDGDFPSLFLWLRFVAGQTLSDIHRRHLGTRSRSVLRESKPHDQGLGGNTLASLSQRFVAHITSPSQAVGKQELIAQVSKALEGMNEIDREVLALRHFEELTNQEVAIELGISGKASSIRYMRALERLRNVLHKL